jgi:DNA polymerase-3 subunit epsilon
LPPLQERQFELLVVDPLVIDKWLDRYRKGSRKLEAICAHYGAVLDEAHDADFDAHRGRAARVVHRREGAGRPEGVERRDGPRAGRS